MQRAFEEIKNNKIDGDVGRAKALIEKMNDTSFEKNYLVSSFPIVKIKTYFVTRKEDGGRINKNMTAVIARGNLTGEKLARDYEKIIVSNTESRLKMLKKKRADFFISLAVEEHFLVSDTQLSKHALMRSKTTSESYELYLIIHKKFSSSMKAINQSIKKLRTDTKLKNAVRDGLRICRE